jgi:hypothetical protein
MSEEATQPTETAAPQKLPTEAPKPEDAKVAEIVKMEREEPKKRKRKVVQDGKKLDKFVKTKKIRVANKKETSKMPEIKVTPSTQKTIAMGLLAGAGIAALVWANKQGAASVTEDPRDKGTGPKNPGPASTAKPPKVLPKSVPKPLPNSAPFGSVPPLEF